MLDRHGKDTVQGVAMTLKEILRRSEFMGERRFLLNIERGYASRHANPWMGWTCARLVIPPSVRGDGHRAHRLKLATLKI